MLFFEKNISHSLHYSEEALRKGDLMCEKAMHYLSVMHEKLSYHLSKTGNLASICQGCIYTSFSIRIIIISFNFRTIFFCGSTDKSSRSTRKILIF